MAQTDMPEEFSTGPSTCTRSKGWRSGSCSRERRAQPAPSRIRSPMGRCPEGRVWRSRSKPRAISGRPNEDASVAVRVVAQGAGGLQIRAELGSIPTLPARGKPRYASRQVGAEPAHRSMRGSSAERAAGS